MREFHGIARDSQLFFRSYTAVQDERLRRYGIEFCEASVEYTVVPDPGLPRLRQAAPCGGRDLRIARRVRRLHAAGRAERRLGHRLSRAT